MQGLEDGRFALISKAHHALVDGIAGVDLATVLFDLEPVPPAVPHEGEPWAPQPEPSAASLAARGIRGIAAAAVLARRPGDRRRDATRRRRCTRRARRSRASPRSPGRA